ncbi:MAG: hypothetical protein WEC33_02780 [Dehalococcoidia bacterium]
MRKRVRGRAAVAAVILAALGAGSGATAQGPLTGSIKGAINTENDVDWFFFYAEGWTQLDIALTGVGPEGSCSRWTVELMDPNGEYLSDARAEFNQVDHILYTVPDPGKYYLKTWGYCEDVGNYRIDIAASPPLLTEPPYIPPPAAAPPSTGYPSSGAATRRSRACQQARGRVTALRRQVRRARSRAQRARLRANLRRARSQVRKRC